MDAIYLLALILASPWLLWRRVRYRKNRRGWPEKLFGNVAPRPGAAENRDCIWLHAVSVGEVNLLAPILDELRKQLPGWRFAVSVGTETGYDLARTKYPHDKVFFCPLDFSWAVRRTLRRLNPSMILLAELELWPNMIRIANRRNVAIGVVNGRLGENSFRGYQRLGWFVRRMTKHLWFVAAQSEEYAERFRRLGVPADRVSVTGNVKFDGVQFDRNNTLTSSLMTMAGLGLDDIVFVAGSTQPEEDRMAALVWKKLRAGYANLKLILVPRHPQNVAATESFLNEQAIRYRLRSRLTGPSDKADDVLIVDTIGELRGWWGAASVAYVGGSMGKRGGQNMIEPAAFGVPVCFGPNTRNFRDVTDLLLANDASKVVHDAEELEKFVRTMIDAPDSAIKMGCRAVELLQNQLGATGRTVDRILKHGRPVASTQTEPENDRQARASAA